MAHTPGPWDIGTTGMEVWGEHFIIGPAVLLWDTDPKVTEADAALIAAAPDLLAMLERVVEQGFGSDCFIHHAGLANAIQDAREVIAKAKGAVPADV